ncbi:hypothetical protein RhiirB3_417779, partial [Rhizophagus irregularis]
MEMGILNYLKFRERQWQHREETVATNREQNKFEIGRKLAEWDDAERGQEEYYKDRARELASMNEADSVKPKLTLNLASKCRAALIAPAEDEEFDDEEGIESKRKRRILVPLEYNVKREELDENILSEKLQPFAKDELVSLLLIIYVKKPAEERNDD